MRHGLAGRRTTGIRHISGDERRSVPCREKPAEARGTGDRHPHGGASGKKVVGRVGLEPTTKGLCVPLRLSPPVSGSWSGLCLAFRPSRRVSTRSCHRPGAVITTPVWQTSLGIGTEAGRSDRHHRRSATPTRAFTEFEKFYSGAEQTYPVQPVWGLPCPRPSRRPERLRSTIPLRWSQTVRGGQRPTQDHACAHGTGPQERRRQEHPLKSSALTN